MTTDFFDFGSDSSHYNLSNHAHRSGVVFYARPEAARRGFELGLMAIKLFAARRPDVPIHFYGDRIRRLPFRFTDHGRISPPQLNEIYNRCNAGLSLSMTNVSLVPHEMLAAGCIPVVNDAPHNRAVLNNPFVRYVPPYPAALAMELERLVSMSDFPSIARAASASVHSATWEDAGSKVDSILRRALRVEVRPPAMAETHEEVAR
jgi:glycosyltransferase involved in cell wall biosynthesis